MAGHTENLSPCIRQCCLNENDICLGCYRTLDEITGWRDKSEQLQKQILVACQQRKAKAAKRA